MHLLPILLTQLLQMAVLPIKTKVMRIRSLTGTNQITVIGSPLFSWIYIYVFDANHIFTHDRDTQPIATQKIMLLVDSTYKHVISGVEGENATQVNRLKNIYNNTDIVALFRDDSSKIDRKIYPFTGLDSASIGSVTQEIRAN